MNLRALLSAYRKQHRMPLRSLAKRLGVGHTVLFRFMNGHEIDAHNYIAIVRWTIAS